MRWEDVRATHPDSWIVFEALDAHSDGHRRVIDRMAIVEVCTDGGAAFSRYRELHATHPNRELYFAHTGNVVLEIDERPWVGIRYDDAARPSE